MNDSPVLCNGNARKTSVIDKFYHNVTRKKSLGLSNTIGSPLYILTGVVLRHKAGPALILSYLISAVSSICAALTYSELVNQVNTRGSDYVYSYVAMGELYGFLIGWNLILEYCVDVASVCKALTNHIDRIYLDGDITKWQQNTVSIPSDYFSDYIDIFSVALCLILTMVVAMGGKFSNVVNNFMTCFNLVCYISIIVFGSFSCDISYWYSVPESTNKSLMGAEAAVTVAAKNPAGSSYPVGFMPFGLTGAFRGAGSCIFAFAGFRAIFSDGNVNSRNPRKDLPTASLTTLLVSCVLYVGVSLVVSCMVSAYDIDVAAPIFSAFNEHGLVPLQKLLAIGAITGLVQAAVYKFLPLPPLLTMMSDDGLLFKFLGETDHETDGPFKGTIFYGFVSTMFVAVFVLEELIDMLSIGTLIAYMMASVSLIRLRYVPYTELNGYGGRGPCKSNIFTERKVKIALLIYMTAACTFGLLTANLDCKSIIFIIAAIILSIIMVGCGLLIYIQPQWVSRLHCGPFQQSVFYCPAVPTLPLFAIFLNAILLMHLSYKTWIRFVIWITIGLIVYFTYSIRNSNLSERNKNSQTMGDEIPTIISVGPINGLPAQRTRSSLYSSRESSRDSNCVPPVAMSGPRRASTLTKQASIMQESGMQITSFPDQSSGSFRRSSEQDDGGGGGSARASPSNRMQVTSFPDRTVLGITRDSDRIMKMTSFAAARSNTAPELEHFTDPRASVSEGARVSERSQNTRGRRKGSLRSYHLQNNSFPQQSRRQSCSVAMVTQSSRSQKTIPPWRLPRNQDISGGGSTKNRDEEVTVRLREWRDFLRKQAEERQLAWSMSKLHGNNTTILEVPGSDV